MRFLVLSVITDKIGFPNILFYYTFSIFLKGASIIYSMHYSHIYDYRRYFLLIIAMMGLLRRILKTMLSLYEANNASKPYTYESVCGC